MHEAPLGDLFWESMHAHTFFTSLYRRCGMLASPSSKLMPPTLLPWRHNRRQCGTPLNRRCFSPSSPFTSSSTRTCGWCRCVGVCHVCAEQGWLEGSIPPLLPHSILCTRGGLHAAFVTLPPHLLHRWAAACVMSSRTAPKPVRSSANTSR